MRARTSGLQLLPHLVMGIALCFAPGCLLLPRIAYGQAVQDQPSVLDSALAKVKAGRAIGADVVVIANAGAIQAIPALEEQFKRETNIDSKLSIAAGLVKLKDQDPIYWDFLLEQATLAVDSDVPDPVFDSRGNPRQTPGSAEFEAWAQAHHVDANTVIHLTLFGLPGKVLQLGSAGDPRGIPLLRRALQSHNSMIVVMAAKSLAELQDKDSIPFIIEACRRSEVIAGTVAETSLLFFDDSRAQAAVDVYVPPDRAKVWRDARTQGLKP